MFYFSLGPVVLFWDNPNDIPYHEEYACHAAMVAHTIHYLRRIVEVLFVHRFRQSSKYKIVCSKSKFLTTNRDDGKNQNFRKNQNFSKKSKF